MDKKINVLCVPSDTTGVGMFRSLWPHLGLEDKYPNEFHIDIVYQPELDNDEWLKQYDIIHYHRTLGPFEMMASLNERLKNLGIVSIMDIDDHWAPGMHHPAYHIVKNNKLDQLILQNLRIADNVTTTTDIFAKEIRKYNKNVYVLPNAVNPKEKQFTPNLEPSKRLRIGWLGGSSHEKDLEILNGIAGRLKSDGLLDNVQFVLCGFDVRGTHTDIDPVTKQSKIRNITPKESVWYRYEKIFTSNYTTISQEYKDFLHKFTKEEYPNIENEPYRRVWTKDVSIYATNYNLFDISLAPLEENPFNAVKSQLKIIEAGFHKKAIIAQNFGPYTIDIKNAIQFGGGFDETANGILISKDRNHKDWYKNIKLLIQNPHLVKILQENLYNSIKDKYSIDAVSETRRELYLKLYHENKKILA